MPMNANDIFEGRCSMNVPDVSSLSQRSQDYDRLQNSLKAGNLPGAQTAFAAFLQDVQKTATLAGPASLFGPGTQASRDLEALGGALKSANLSGAQTAFASLQKDIQVAGESGNGLHNAHAHHPLTRAEVANNGAAVIGAAARGSAAQSIGSILNLKA
jgi:hypothetical protein